MQLAEASRKSKPPQDRLQLQRRSIMEIKRNVESIRNQNQLHRRELQQYFLTRSHVEGTVYASTLKPPQLRPPMLRPQNPEQEPVKLQPKFQLQERFKTEQLDSVRRRSMVNRTTAYLNFSAEHPEMKEAQVQTIAERPFRSESIQQINLALLAKRQDSDAQNRHHTLYSSQIGSFESQYEVLNSLMGSLRKKQRVLQQSLLEFVNAVPSLAFIDEFISEYEPASQRVLRTARIMELVSVMYLVVEMSKGTLMENYNSLVNALGYAAANLIFLARLFIMREGSQDISTSRFEEVIDRFERTAYYEQLTDEQDILLRMQHNNEILAKIELQLSATNAKFYSRIKHFVKGYHRERYTYGLAFIFLFEYLAFHLHDCGMAGISPFLDVAPTPYLPPTPVYKKHLVVIEPINVLVWERGSRFYIRPYTHEFLMFLSEHAEVVLWTYLMPKEIKGLLDQIDIHRDVGYRLFRYHCSQSVEGLPIKDPSRLGRSLEDVLFIDFDRKNVHSFENVLELYWKGSRRDRRLLDLSDILADMFRTVPSRLTQRCTVNDMIKTRGKELREVETAPPRRLPFNTLKMPFSKRHF